MKPRCEECKACIGWTRYIRRVHYGRSIICWACSFRQAWRAGERTFS